MDKQKKNLLVFGYGVVLIALFFAYRLYVKHGWGNGSSVALGIAVVFFLITVFSQSLLKKIYDRWMKVAHFIGMIVTTIILSVLFLFIFGVVGIVLRILRKDLLDQAIQPEQKSYWKAREKNYNKLRFTQQF